jgi:hypothetical protein
MLDIAAELPFLNNALCLASPTSLAGSARLLILPEGFIQTNRAGYADV